MQTFMIYDYAKNDVQKQVAAYVPLLILLPYYL